MGYNNRRQIMITSNMLLDMLAAHLGSDYRTSKTLGKAANYVANMRGRGGILPDAQGLKAAEILGIPAEFVLLSLAAERAMAGEHFEKMEAIADKFQPPKINKMLKNAGFL